MQQENMKNDKLIMEDKTEKHEKLKASGYFKTRKTLVNVLKRKDKDITFKETLFYDEVANE